MAYMETRAAALHYIMFLSAIVAAALERANERLRDPVRRSVLQQKFMADGRSHFIVLSALHLQLTRIYGHIQEEISESGTRSTQALWIRVYRQIYKYQLIRPVLNHVTGHRFPKIFEPVHIHWGSIICNFVPDLWPLFIIFRCLLWFLTYCIWLCMTYSVFCDIDVILLLLFVYIFIFVICFLDLWTYFIVYIF